MCGRGPVADKSALGYIEQMAASPAFQRWANALTLLRLLSMLPCAWAVVASNWAVAAALFVLAVVTDLADGPVARRADTPSALGGLFDHGTDALFVVVLLFALNSHAYIPWVLPGLVAIAFAQYVWDSRAHSAKPLRASWLGRCNGVAYFVLVGIPVIRNALSLQWPDDLLITILAWALVATTLASIVNRWLSYRHTQAP